MSTIFAHHFKRDIVVNHIKKNSKSPTVPGGETVQQLAMDYISKN